LWSEATGQLAGSQIVIGRVAQAHVFFEQIDSGRPIARPPSRTLQGVTYSGVAHFLQSEYGHAVSAEGGIAACNRVRNAFFLALSLTYMGFSLANQGRISEALASMHEALGHGEAE